MFRISFMSSGSWKDEPALAGVSGGDVAANAGSPLSAGRRVVLLTAVSDFDLADCGGVFLFSAIKFSISACQREERCRLSLLDFTLAAVAPRKSWTARL